MGSVKREVPPPPGPIAALFEHLDDLHSQAGRPAMREIARRAGRGNISPSTVHNIFSSSRVPRWDFIERIVTALGGASVQEEFSALWQAAWRAQNQVETPGDGPSSTRPGQGRGGGQHSGFVPGPVQRALPGGSRDWTEATPRQSQRTWWNEIPSRNTNFTGRGPDL